MSQATIVQAVSKVTRAKKLLAETSPKEAIEGLTSHTVEACSQYHGTIVAAPYHPFIAAIDAAFCGHRPLVLSPDMFWLLISQGFARHVNFHSKELRERLVKHSRKKAISVRRDDFVKGSPENPWSEVFDEFSAQINQRIGEQNHSNIVVSFSTTGPVETAANEIVLMTSLKSYFDYDFCTLCGIPEIQLEGTPEDWEHLHHRTLRLGEAYDLSWWTNRIGLILERIAKNAAGTSDSELWKNIYKVHEASGGPYINGWILDFIPYLQGTGYINKESKQQLVDMDELFANPGNFFEKKIEISNRLLSDKRGEGITADTLPGSLCKVPFNWQYLDRHFKMAFLAGFIGFTQHTETMAVRPKIGWAVCET